MDNQDSPTFSADQRWIILDLSLCATLSWIFGVKDGVVFFFFLLLFMYFFMYLHFSPFNPFTLRPRYDVMRFFVALTLEFLDEFLWLNISHETSLTGLFFSSISAFFSPLATGSVRGERAGLS